LDKEPLLDIPIYESANPQPFITLVDKILLQKSVGEDTTVLERTLDALVYKLYALSYAEVWLVSPDFGLSAAEYAAISIGD
jgi:adenine-specific DNA-methyltransferase